MQTRFLARLIILALMTTLLAASATATVRRITFEEPGLSEYLSSIVSDGVTVRFLTRARVITPGVGTASGTHALLNAGQDRIGAEVGFQIPFEIEFDHLQQRVSMVVGLADREETGDPVAATLIAYNSAGVEVARSNQRLGLAAQVINVPISVQTSSDQIWRVRLEYSGNNAEVLDNLEFASDTTVTVPGDTTAPVVSLANPREGATANSQTIYVSGRIAESNGVHLTVNGVAMSVRRSDSMHYEFGGTVTLPSGSNRVTALAIDDAGNRGSDQRTVNFRIPTSFNLTNVVFTQTGVMDSAVPRPARLVGRKTGLFKMTLTARSADGQPTYVDYAQVAVIHSGRDSAVFRGDAEPPSGVYFGPTTPFTHLQDGSPIYSIIDGSQLRYNEPNSFEVRLFVGGRQVYRQVLGTDWTFSYLKGIAVLLVPQHSALNADYTRSLLFTMDNFARFYPVPDGICDLTADGVAGVRFAVLPPADYEGHLDPADDSTIAYEQGWLLRDHRVGGPGPDNMSFNTDDSFDLWSGEYLPINFTFPEDDNRNGVLDANEAARRMGSPSPLNRRMSNWSTFIRSNAESARIAWNTAHGATYSSRRAVALVRWGPDQQNRTGWLGNAGGGETSFWMSIDTGGNPSLPHEVGHTLGLGHTDDIPMSGAAAAGLRGDATSGATTCSLTGSSINLRDRMFFAEGYSMMCSGVGGSTNAFILPGDYVNLFDQFVALGRGRIASVPRRSSRFGSLGFAPAGFTQSDSEKMFVLIGSVDKNGGGNVFESYATNAPLDPSDDGGDKTYTAAFVQKGGGVVIEYPLNVSFKAPDSPVELSQGVFSLVKPLPDQAMAVEIRKDGKTIMTVNRSASAPNLGGIKVGEIKKANDGPRLPLSWEMSDPDGDALTCQVSYSLDGGKTFIPVKSGIKTSQTTLSVNGLAGGKNVVIKVKATDGFNTAEETAEGISLPNKAPVSAILSPKTKTAFYLNDEINFHGAALDPEQGLLDGKSLRWQLIDGKNVIEIGNGPDFHVKGLVAGNHTIRLIATDRDGAKSSDQIAISVLSEGESSNNSLKLDAKSIKGFLDQIGKKGKGKGKGK